MCGIVGYFGTNQAQEVLIEGLSKLEYRGYDSAGVSILKNGSFDVVKTKGRLKNLTDRLNAQPVLGHVGIGHTRWATHGEPSDVNSHPHVSNNGTIAVVHNGIIENYHELKGRLKREGIEFKSETDTEVIPNLIAIYSQVEGDFVKAVLKTVQDLKGSFALAVISNAEPDKLIAVRKDSPLIVGIGDHETFIASDVPAILKYTNQVVYLDNMEIAVLSKDAPVYFDFEGTAVQKTSHEITWTAELAEKGGFDHFTLKEIFEQPQALRDTMIGRIHPESPIQLDDIKVTKEELMQLNRIYIVACGTAYHAGLVGKKAIEMLTRIPVDVEVSSEFRYGDPIIDEKSLVIVISQSGETADTLAVLKESQARGARVLAVTNVVGSSIARDADDVFYTWAGPEIGVASTKAYLTQLVAMYTLGLHFAELLGVQSSIDPKELKQGLLDLPRLVEETLLLADEIKTYAQSMYMAHDVYFLGRGIDNVTALEGSLKLKELTYIHSESYPGGELKHGPIALIEKDTVVISPITQKPLIEKMVSNLREVQTRGSKNLVITMQDYADFIKEGSDQTILIPQTMDLLSPVLTVVPLQLLAYYVSVAKGFDVDKPRNLAKSVTVE